MTEISTTRPGAPVPVDHAGLSPVVPSTGQQVPVPAGAVRLEDGFWFERQRLNTDALLDHCDTWIDRMGWYDAFRVAAGEEPRKPLQGKLFTDADVYKLLEAFAWELAQRPDPDREARFAELARLVAAAQGDDGYLNTYFGPKGDETRYTDLAHGHELYCAGHLFQAAVARLRSGKEDDLTQAALRLADRICEDFGEAGREGSDGHPEIEMGLMELYRATGRTRYLEQARRFIDQRGHRTFQHHPIGHEYYLDDMPVRDATVLRGHVVRAMYLTAGAVDLAVETGDDELLGAVSTQWENTWARRTYLTGGMGSRHLGESFGRDFELSPDRAYAETCGAVGSIMAAWRLLLATGEAQYADAIERLLYNMIATSPNAEGDRFFYVNPLLQREPGIATEPGEAPFRKDTLRANWFWVSCCPTNVVRTLASLTGYFATVSDGSLTVQQYFDGTIDTRLEDGRPVALQVRTDYPWQGRVEVTVASSPGRFRLRLRVPSWAGGATVTVGGVTTPAQGPYAELERVWSDGDAVVLDLPMPAVVLQPDARIDALRGTVAVQRGPLVYCAESVVDAADAVDLDRFRIDAAADLELREAGGPSDVRATIRATGVMASAEPDGAWPYRPVTAAPRSAADEEVVIDLIPYYAWSNRGPSTMRVWIPSASAER